MKKRRIEGGLSKEGERERRFDSENKPYHYYVIKWSIVKWVIHYTIIFSSQSSYSGAKLPPAYLFSTKLKKVNC